DLLKPSVYGVGYLGAGRHNYTTSPEAYKKWTAMLSRCYNTKSTGWLSYGGDGVRVSKEWHNFQNFAKWFTSYKFKEDGWHLDKDILVKGNKLYCPEFCCIVPRIINQSIVSRTALRGEYAQGVHWDKKLKRYVVALN